MPNLMSTSLPSVTILVLNWNGREVLPRCLEALISLDYPEYRVVVADNGSTDDSMAVLLNTYSEVQVIDLGYNLGFRTRKQRRLFLHRASERYSCPVK